MNIFIIKVRKGYVKLSATPPPPPLDGRLIYPEVTPKHLIRLPWQFTGTKLILLDGERHCERKVFFPSTQHDDLVRSRTQTSPTRLQLTNKEATALPHHSEKSSFFFLLSFLYWSNINQICLPAAMHFAVSDGSVGLLSGKGTGGILVTLPASLIRAMSNGPACRNGLYWGCKTNCATPKCIPGWLLPLAPEIKRNISRVRHIALIQLYISRSAISTIKIS